MSDTEKKVVWKIGKELGLSAAQTLKWLSDAGIPAKSASSAVDYKEALVRLSAFVKKQATEAPAQANDPVDVNVPKAADEADEETKKAYEIAAQVVAERRKAPPVSVGGGIVIQMKELLTRYALKYGGQDKVYHLYWGDAEGIQAEAYKGGVPVTNNELSLTQGAIVRCEKSVLFVKPYDIYLQGVMAAKALSKRRLDEPAELSQGRKVVNSKETDWGSRTVTGEQLAAMQPA